MSESYFLVISCTKSVYAHLAEGIEMCREMVAEIVLVILSGGCKA